MSSRRLAPSSTYRLQLNSHFRFEDARAIVPYLDALGIGHIYASPYFFARPGSNHGYDVVDPNAFNPEIGTAMEHAALIAAAQERGIGHILDFVPNHMGIGTTENRWWQDVLEWGERSPYARYFDIDWRPQKLELHGKVLVALLGDHFGAVLERGELALCFAAPEGTFAIAYGAHRFPLAPFSYRGPLGYAADRLDPERADALRVLVRGFGDLERPPRTEGEREAQRLSAAELKASLGDLADDAVVRGAIVASLAHWQATEKDPAACDRLEGLVREQHYRLAYWRVSSDEINYRRFFDINDLAGLRVEDGEVLAQTHRLLFALIAEGKIDGVRIDHIDGLAEPAGYANVLRTSAEALGHPVYFIVEKILARFETLRRRWNVDGTTGYDFSALVNGLFVEPRAEAAFDRIYRRFAGVEGDFDEVAYDARKRIMRTSLASELTVLVTMIDRIAAMDRRSNDFTLSVLRDALVEVVASFPVYRTYFGGEGPEEEDRRFVEWAVGLARKRSELGDSRVFDFIEGVLTLDAAANGARYERTAIVRFAMKFQQYTAPVAAKGVEDTAFYRYVRLLSLNDVGSDPRRFGTGLRDFHRLNAERLREHPDTLVATATHDHKRGEDVRTRLDALTEMPGLWSLALRRWSRFHERRKTSVDGALAPSANDEYFLYQTLLGTWPTDWFDGPPPQAAARAPYLERLEAYLVKAAREAKVHSSWTNANIAYEEALVTFARRLVDPARSGPFMREFLELARLTGTLGMISSLAQTTLKFTVPGVPDLYQGCELWDLSLVDPDNRRPVDFATRERLIASFAERRARGEQAALARELLLEWHSGAIKAFAIWRLMHARRDHRETFARGAYRPLGVLGTHASKVCAFARGDILVVVPRLVRRLLLPDAPVSLAFHDERVRVPATAAGRYRDLFTGIERSPGGRFLDVDELLSDLPMCVLVPA